MEEAGTTHSPPTEKPRLIEKDISGLKYFDQIAPLLKRLHEDGCERDKADNRKLHYDQYCMMMLLYFFNPIITSLRGIQQASELKNVRQSWAAIEHRSDRCPMPPRYSMRND